MKAEINNENKAKFFALYMGQDIVIPDGSAQKLTGVFNGSFIESVSAKWWFLMNHKRELGLLIPYGKLLLKPLSKISDEDAIFFCGGIPEGYELFKIYNLKKDGYLGVKIRSPYSESEIKFNEDGYRYDVKSPNRNWENLDYLRSRGYALPWMGLTVEEMVEVGWIKLA